MKMSPGISRGDQMKKLKLFKQGFNASRKVSYCEETEPKKEYLGGDVPPVSLIWFYLLCALACHTETRFCSFLLVLGKMFVAMNVMVARISFLCYLNTLVRRIPDAFYIICSALFLVVARWIFVSSATFLPACLSMLYSTHIYDWITAYFLYTRPPVLKPQSGIFSRYLSDTDVYLREAILLFTLFETLRDAKTKRGIISAITMYLQAHSQKSLFLQGYNWINRNPFSWRSMEGELRVEEMINEAFGTTGENDDGELVLEPHTADEMPWYLAIDEAFKDWKKMRKSGLSSKMCKFINILVSAGMCSAACLTFKLGNLSLFTPIVEKKQVQAGDVFEAFYEAIVGFMKGGWRVYSTGEVSAFFTENTEIDEFEKAFNKIRSLHGYAIAGNLLTHAEMEDNDYDVLLKETIKLGEKLQMYIKSKVSFERKFITDRLDRVRVYETEFTQLRIRGGQRIEPFAVSLHGASGAGKSGLTQITIRAMLLYNSLCAAADRIAIWADNDKFASTVRSHINALIFDDFANTNENFMDFSPAYRLLQVVNRVKFLAPMADVFLKGKVSLNPYIVVVTTNVKDLRACTYSNEPTSILRRFYHIYVKPKKEFVENGKLCKRLVQEKFGLRNDPDAWDFTIEYYDGPKGKFYGDQFFKPVVFEGKIMKDVSVCEYLRWIQLASAQHLAEEKAELATLKEMPVKCEKCDLFYCSCENKNVDVQPELEPHSGEEEEVPRNWWARHFHAKAQRIVSYYERCSTATAIQCQEFCMWWDRFDWLPERWICHPVVLQFGLFFWRENIKRALFAGLMFLTVLHIYCLYLVPFCTVPITGSYLALSYYYVCATMRTYSLMVRERILSVKNVVETYTTSWQFKYALVSVGVIGSIIALLKLRRLDPHTGLEPESVDEMVERESKPNPWQTITRSKLPSTAKARSTVGDELANAIKNNVVGIVSRKSKTTLGTFLCSNFLLVPTHFIDEHKHDGDDVHVKIYRKLGGQCGEFSDDILSKAYRLAIPGTDFTLCYVTTCGAMKDVRQYLPTDCEIPESSAIMLTRDIVDTDVRKMNVRFQGTSVVTHTDSKFVGGYYHTPEVTKRGSCMSPILSNGVGSVIIGFHLGGRGTLGGCGTLTLTQAQMAIAELADVDGVVLSTSSGVLQPKMGDFPKETFGVDILTGTDMHKKSALNFLPEGSNVDFYGTTIGKSTPKSAVVDTLISPFVEEVFGVPQNWGPPKMRGPGVYPYQVALACAAKVSMPLGSLLHKPVVCMKQIAAGLFKKFPTLFADTRPLSEVETVSGIDGMKSLDSMNFASSPGFPNSGSKRKMLVKLNPDDYPHISCPQTFEQPVWDEFYSTREKLQKGERVYSIWKACLKDEATKKTKTKVRVFQSAPLVLQLLIRMYFLPIVRIIQLNPIAFECAVGVNAEGPEWEELWNAAMRKGRSRVLAGDYSKYDLRMPAQATIAAFDILIDIAMKCNYSEEDILVMRALVHEVVYPIMAFNGDLIQLFGTNPSGQNLTVIINSLVNSLLLRSCFYEMFPDIGLEFKKYCSFLTYGDDVIGTVAEAFQAFNHMSYASFLERFDMKFTMPDKESEPKPFMEESEVDFLKRKTYFNEDLGMQVGILSEDSIFKRLHAHLCSDMSMREHSIVNMQTSLHDWFYYGRDVFEKRRGQLKEVAIRAGLLDECDFLNRSYDERVALWKYKYADGPRPGFLDKPVLEPHFGSIDDTILWDMRQMCPEPPPRFLDQDGFFMIPTQQEYFIIYLILGVFKLLYVSVLAVFAYYALVFAKAWKQNRFGNQPELTPHTGEIVNAQTSPVVAFVHALGGCGLPGFSPEENLRLFSYCATTWHTLRTMYHPIVMSMEFGTVITLDRIFSNFMRDLAHEDNRMFDWYYSRGRMIVHREDLLSVAREHQVCDNSYVADLSRDLPLIFEWHAPEA